MFQVNCILIVSILILAKTHADPSCKCSIVSKKAWGGVQALEVQYIPIPTKFVIIHHTYTPTCSSETTCSERVKNMQSYHMNERKFSDIGYNFMIGGDGQVYEGRGWHKQGAHTRNYNAKSICIAFIGDFTNNLPNNKQLETAKILLECGVKLGELDEEYKLIPAKEVSATLSPGQKLVNELKTWPHYGLN